MMLYPDKLYGPTLLYAVQATAGMHALKLLQETDYDYLIDKYLISTTYENKLWTASLRGVQCKHPDRKTAAMRALVEVYLNGAPIDIPERLMVAP